MTLSTSVCKRLSGYALGDAAAAGFLALFGAVYESFSHGVYSGWMLYAFAVPLLLGTVPMLVLLRRALAGRQVPCARALMRWHFAVAAWAVGAVMQGVLVIYGTTNRLIAVYPAAGMLLAILAFCAQRRSPQSDSTAA